MSQNHGRSRGTRSKGLFYSPSSSRLVLSERELVPSSMGEILRAAEDVSIAMLSQPLDHPRLRGRHFSNSTPNSSILGHCLRRTDYSLSIANNKSPRLVSSGRRPVIIMSIVCRICPLGVIITRQKKYNK